MVLLNNEGSVKRICAMSTLVLIVALQTTIAPASAFRSTTRNRAFVPDTVKPVHVDCPSTDVPGEPTGCYLIPPGIHKIKHVIIILQENRSFDSYFGTYPGADSIRWQTESRRSATRTARPHLRATVSRHLRREWWRTLTAKTSASMTSMVGR